MPNGLAEALSVLLLAVVLVWAIARPAGLPEAVAAVPAAGIVVGAGLLGWADARDEIVALAPTLAFLAGILVLAHLCRAEGVFEAAGDLMARHAAASPPRLLLLVFVVAALVTAILSLDATVVLLTPVVLTTTARLGVRPRPHAYATAHLANSASLLLPVSNLTNLLALGASGLGFVAFSSLMLAPWLVALAVEFAVLRWFFAADLSVRPRPTPPPPRTPVPVFALAVVSATLAGFVASSSWGIEPFWCALAGAAVLLARRLVRRPREAGREVVAALAAAHGWFLAFVAGLGVVVAAVVHHGAADLLRDLLPTGTGWGSLVLLAFLAAGMANLVNNLPAVLVLLPLVAPAGPIAVLAVLIGVNVGPNLTYVGSLATLLWRRVLARHDEDADLASFTILGLLTVPLVLVLSTSALWAVARLAGY